MTFDMRSAMELSRLSSRGVFGKALSEIEPELPNLMVVVADVASSARVGDIARNAPQKFVNVGIAEQNMVGVAAGLASCGKTVFVSSFAPFASMRCFEMLRTQVGYMNLDVKVAALMSGMSNGTIGNTHFGLEDIAILRKDSPEDARFARWERWMDEHLAALHAAVCAPNARVSMGMAVVTCTAERS